MALNIKNKKLTNGLSVPEAYINIKQIGIVKNQISFIISVYKNDLKEIELESIGYQCEYAIDVSNPFIQAYDYLKTLDEFKDAEDV